MKTVLCWFAVLTLSACAVKTKHGETTETPAAPLAQAAPIHSETAANPPPAELMPAKIEAHHSADTHTEKGVDPEISMRWLANGNTRFVKRHWRKDGQSKADIARLSTGQKPHAIVLSCSDSRVPPELVFDQKLGEIFTVRTAGQTLGGNAIGSIEYAAQHLGARMIVVMGHTSCGAVKAAHGTLDGSSAGSPSLDELVRDIHPRLAAFKGQEPSEGWEKESWSNAMGVANDLMMRSTMLAEMKKRGHIDVVPALYDLKSGRVTFRGDWHPDVRTPAGGH